MKSSAIALFGEAEKGEYRTPYSCQNLFQLVEYLGHPPMGSKGLDLAVKALLYEWNIIFIRVREEGFSEQDYFQGARLLEDLKERSPLTAIGLPGVGDAKIIDTMIPLCLTHHSILIITEADLFDYLTQACA